MKKEQAGAVLTVHCGAVVRNWRKLKGIVGQKTDCAAVLKADGYGLGASKITEALLKAGCRTFFSAYDFEAEPIRALSDDARIFVLHGVFEGTEQEFVDNRLIPVLNSPEQLAHWRRYAQKTGRALPCALHIDTGMSRAGLTRQQVSALTADDFNGLSLVLVMSHLARADDPAGDAMNAAQLQRFQEETGFIQTLVSTPFERSLSATFGVFLGTAYHFDLVRPGRGLYGFMDGFEPVFDLKARIVQIQDAAAYQMVGYGATDCLKRDGKLATVCCGYADGYLRALSGEGFVAINGKKAPLVGRVSMDLMTVDVSDFTPEELAHADYAEIIGPHVDIGMLAQTAKTIDYEMMVRLGKRAFFCYDD